LQRNHITDPGSEQKDLELIKGFLNISVLRVKDEGEIRVVLINAPRQHRIMNLVIRNLQDKLHHVGCDPEPYEDPDHIPSKGLMYDMQPEFIGPHIPQELRHKHTMTNLSDRPHDEKQRGDIVYRFKKIGALQPTAGLGFSPTDLPLPPEREVGPVEKTRSGVKFQRPIK
jgi:hypothetical protein